MFRKHPGILGGRYVGVRVSQPAGAGADRYGHYSICTVLIFFFHKLTSFLEQFVMLRVISGEHESVCRELPYPDIRRVHAV